MPDDPTPPNSDDLKDYYGLLGVKPDAKIEDIRKAYYKLQRIYHPDKGHPEAETMSRSLVEAYEVLSKEQMRREYDASLRSLASKQGPAAKADTPDKQTAVTVYAAAGAAPSADLADRGDQQALVDDFLAGKPKEILGEETRTLDETGAMRFKTQTECDDFLKYQSDPLKREFTLSADVQGTSKGYNKYDPNIMGFKDGTQYKGHLDEIHKTMAEERQKIVVEQKALQADPNATAEQKIAKEEALRMQDYKINRVETIMGKDYNPANNKSPPTQATQAIEDKTPQIKMDETAKKEPGNLLKPPASTKSAEPRITTPAQPLQITMDKSSMEKIPDKKHDDTDTPKLGGG